jgi:hypothetical protein
MTTMKTHRTGLLALAFACVASDCLFGQGVFVYDQQSSDESYFGGAGVGIQSHQPIGQSFMPALSSVGFIRLSVGDGTANNGTGATIVVNLRTDSITGTIVGTSDAVVLPDNFGRGTNGVVNFLFPVPVPVTPGIEYFFQPVVETGDPFGVAYYNTFNCAGGTAYYQGASDTFFDMWFREGIVVPEPSAATLMLMGIGSLAFRFTRPKSPSHAPRRL